MNNRVRLCLLIVCLLASFVVLSIGTAVLAFTAEYRGRIVPGVSVEGVDLGGLDRHDALQLLRQSIPQPRPDSVLVFFCPEGYTWEVDYGAIDYTHDYELTVRRALEIGKQVTGIQDLRALFGVTRGGVDLELRTDFSRDAVRRILEQVRVESAHPPEDTQIAFDGDTVTLLPGRPGRELDLEATMAQVERTGLRQHRIPLVFREIEPELSLESMQFLNTRLGFYVTSFNPEDKGRTHNIQLASEALNNRIIHPGKVFSLNEALGPRTPENNYVLAPVFVSGRIVLDYGGGVCQVASTLYNAVLDAELPVIERHGHSQPVPYVPPGRDATIVRDILDFKFKNDRQYPLLLSSRVEGDKLLVSIFGHCRDAQNIIYETRTEREVIPHDTEFRVDMTLQSGEIRILVPGREGYELSTYQVAIVNNEVVHRELISHRRVEPQNAVILIAPADKSRYNIDK